MFHSLASSPAAVFLAICSRPGGMTLGSFSPSPLVPRDPPKGRVRSDWSPHEGEDRVVSSTAGPVGPGMVYCRPSGAGVAGKHEVSSCDRRGLAFFCRVCESVVARATSWCRGPVIFVRRHDHEDTTVNTPEPNPDSFLAGPEGRHSDSHRWDRMELLFSFLPGA